MVARPAVVLVRGVLLLVLLHVATTAVSAAIVVSRSIRRVLVTVIWRVVELTLWRRWLLLATHV